MVELPAFCDIHVHFREPGQTWKETIRTGSLAAARGGYTLVCAMPNLDPVPDSPEHLAVEQAAIDRDAVITVLPYCSITKERKGRELVDFHALKGRCVAFSDDGSGVQSEEMMRKAMDPMRWSFNKLHALWELYRLDKTQNWKSYVFPNLRFHERWKEWSEDDFTLPELRAHNELLGWSPLMERSGLADYQPISVAEDTEYADFAPYMEMYLDRITALCEEKDISLILVLTPDTRANAEQHRTMKAYAEDKGIAFLDFNEQAVWEAMDYDLAADNADYEHPNVSGAQKLSRALGEYLRSVCTIRGGQGSPWENSRSWYRHILDEWALRWETEPEPYCGKLETLACTVFLAAGEDWADTAAPSVRAFLSGLGAKPQEAFWAVLENGSAVSSGTEASASGSFRSGRSRYEIRTAKPCSIVLDGQEQAKEGEGVSLVVYDSPRRRLIDSVCLGNTVIR